MSKNKIEDFLKAIPMTSLAAQNAAFGQLYEGMRKEAEAIKGIFTLIYYGLGKEYDGE